jgi:transcriptional regulator with XRE-family HTH domain
MTARPSSAGMADRIKERLAQLNLSPRAASLASGCGPDAIRNILRAADSGREYFPRADMLYSLAKVLQTSPDWLMTGENAP